MDYEQELQSAREWIDSSHQLQLEMIELVFRIAKERDVDPGEVAQVLQMGNMHAFLGPVMHRYHERQQAKYMAMQHQAVQQRAETDRPAGETSAPEG